jgi:hypothetical protein
MRPRLPSLALVACAAFTAACSGSDSTGPSDQGSSAVAAQQLNQLADSLAAHGGDPGEVGAFRGLAGVVAANGRLSTVTITVDGTPSEFIAVGQQMETSPCPPQMLCFAFAPNFTIRNVMAWQKSDPRHYVALTSLDLTGSGSHAVLSYLDGSGQIYIGDATSSSVNVTTSDTPCTVPSGPPEPVAWVNNCTQAEFDVSFAGSVHASPILSLWDSTPAPPAPTTVHTLSMALQAVHGSRIVVPPLVCTGPCPDSGFAPPPVVQPPIMPPPRDSLTASLAVSVGSDVAFTFTVRNSSSSPATISFQTSQQYDIRVWNDAAPLAGTLVWRWGADKAFADMLTSRTLQAGESVTWVEHWPKPAAGSYRALAYLTSSSHGAASYATFQVP